MRRLDPEEVANRLAAGKARVERIASQTSRPPATLQLQKAIERAEAALALVVRDIETTTVIRERGDILRYDDWVLDRTSDSLSWVFDGDEPEDEGGGLADDDDDEVGLACRFGGHTFALDGDQSIADIAVDIAFYLQDDVTDEVWAAWPQCPGHPHPMSPAIVGEAAVWECPSGAGVAIPIGQLEAGPRASC
jgi:hypothetical protein